MDSEAIIESPATLVAITVAARKAGDRDLEREMRHRLAEQGIKLVFVRDRQVPPLAEVVAH